MTNRKYVVVFVSIFLSILIFLCGCANKPNTANSVADKFEMIELNNSADSAVKGSPLWKENFTSPYTDDAVDTVFTLDFQNTNYQGEYWYSVVENNNTYISDFYKVEHGWFSINRETKELLSVLFSDYEKGNKTKEECKILAEAVAKQYIDIDKYYFEESVNGDFYGFKYTKLINAYPTNETLNVAFSNGGTLVSFGKNMLNEYNVDSISQDEEERLDELVSRQTTNAAKERFLEEDDKIIETTYNYVKLDGKICVIYNFHIVREIKESDGTVSTGDTSRLILVK